MYITEPAREIPVRYETDLFVAGGSCTGVFAAVRAARLGMRVLLAERQNTLGGTATAGLVNVWHSLKDTDYREQVIGGLSAEMTGRLVKAGFAELSDNPSTAIRFNPFYLQLELDKLIREEKITVLFHTLCVGALADGRRITHALIENKDGRSAVEARFFIDATGDGDLMKYLGLPSYTHDILQPPSPCFLMNGSTDGIPVGKLIHEYGAAYGLDDDFGWDGTIPGCPGLFFRADFHVFGERADSAEGLTAIEFEGRRKAEALVRLINEHTDRHVTIGGFCSSAGIRETVHYATKLQTKGDDLLAGKRYDDAILNGTYRIDVHNTDGSVILYYLDGSVVKMQGAERTETKWNRREQPGITGEPPKYYQVPFGMLVQETYDNLIAVGRMINADKAAYGALRVMVNLNQLGEAAGTAAFLAADADTSVGALDGKAVRAALIRGGSIL